MVEVIQVFCVNETPRFDPHLRIKNIGGVNANGSKWKLSEDHAIAGIESASGDSTSPAADIVCGSRLPGSLGARI